METIEKIRRHLKELPESLHSQVLDFVEYLIAKADREKEWREGGNWSSFSVAEAMRGMEDEKAPVYTVEDLRERFS